MRFIASVLALVLTVGCSDDTVPGGQPKPDISDGDVWVTFKISNDRALLPSRANDVQGHPEETASAAENFINPDDLTVIIMDSGNRVLKVVEDIKVEEIPGTSFSQYSVIGKINKDYFKMIGQGNSFGILCIANSQGTGGGDTFTMNLWANDLNEISTLLKKYKFVSDADNIWLPDMRNNFIPMSGYLKVTTLSDISEHDTPQKALQLGNVSMQRSMAKIRILDGFKYQGLPYEARILSVAMHNCTDCGAFLPDLVHNPEWRNGTADVEYAAMPSPVHLWRLSEQIVNFEYEPNFVSDGRIYDSFIAYVPEQSVEGSELPPYLTISTVRINADGSKILNEYNVTLSDVIKPIKGQCSLIRNHIYHFDTTLAPPYIYFNPLVLPWQTERQEIKEWEEIK